LALSKGYIAEAEAVNYINKVYTNRGHDDELANVLKAIDNI